MRAFGTVYDAGLLARAIVTLVQYCTVLVSGLQGKWAFLSQAFLLRSSIKSQLTRNDPLAYHGFLLGSLQQEYL